MREYGINRNRVIMALCVILMVGSFTACDSKKKGVGFEELGLVCNVEEGVEYDYISCLSDDTSKDVVLKAEFSDYVTYPHPEKEDYELKYVNLTLTLENLNENAMAVNRCLAYVDYYSLDSERKRAEGDVDSTVGTETIQLEGSEYEVAYSCELINRRFSDDGNTGYMDFTFEYEVPAGYDGVVIALYNHANTEKGSNVVDNFDEDTLFFRLSGSKNGEQPATPENVTEITPKGEVVTVETEYICYSVFEHDDRYIGSNDILAEEFFYIPEGKSVTRDDIAKLFDLTDYYDESHEYTYSEEAELFTEYILNGKVELEHLTEDYMWDTLVECFNTMSYNDVCAVIEANDESSAGIVKKYACEYIKDYTERYIWSK